MTSRSLVRLALVAGALCLDIRAGHPAANGTAAGADWSKAEVVTVAMTEYRFEPERLSLTAGVPYRLRLVNRGTEIHDFSAPGFFRTVRFKDAGAFGSYGTSIVIRPGERKETEFVALAPGSYALTCADHDWAGMAGMIIVK